jgi:hypothetical protein
MCKVPRDFTSNEILIAYSCHNEEESIFHVILVSLISHLELRSEKSLGFGGIVKMGGKFKSY